MHRVSHNKGLLDFLSESKSYICFFFTQSQLHSHNIFDKVQSQHLLYLYTIKINLNHREKRIVRCLCKGHEGASAHLLPAQTARRAAPLP